MTKINIKLQSLLKTVSLFCVVLFFTTHVWALAPFTVKHIRVRGLQHIQLGTVLNYLPFRTGERLHEANTASIIRALYSTGFFKRVDLERQGSTLIINVVERPIISNISILGDKTIGKEKLNQAVRDAGLIRGRIFNKAVLDQVKQDLITIYNRRGQYNAKITTEVRKLKRHRVDVTVTIDEGKPAQIKAIHIIGNKAFSDSTLLGTLLLQKKSFFTFFTGKAKYSKERLTASAEALRTFYMDHGYIKMRVLSTQVKLSEDHLSVYITLRIEEGARYAFEGYNIVGKTAATAGELDKVISIKPGAVFSRKKVADAISAAGDLLGDKGYGFPEINAQPRLDEKKKTVFITFYIKPGQPVYVRRINFSGNIKTADYVLRHAITQFEAALLSLSNIKESQRRLRVLGYFKEVTVKTVPVPGKSDQIDLNFDVKEQPSSEIKAGVGASTRGFIFNASLNQPNFFGTGKTVSFNFKMDNFGQNYAFSYYNPYYSLDGIGRGYSAFYTRTDPNSYTEITSYTADKYGANMTFDVQLSTHTSLQFGAGYEHFKLGNINAVTCGALTVAPQLCAFTAANGTIFNQVRFTAGWQSNTYDRFPFVNKGLHHQINLLLAGPADSKSLQYYKVTYRAKYFQPLFADLILSLGATLGYGNGIGSTKGLPFYENFYAGGSSQGRVRGYDDYSLGPKDASTKKLPLGGNALASGTLALILPAPFSRESVRTQLFVDGGNVYANDLPAAQSGSSSGPLRFSSGVALLWRSPFGPIGLSLAFPLNAQPGDDKQPFQFQISSGF